MSDCISSTYLGENPLLTFKCINELSGSLEFEIPNNEISSKAISLLKSDSSIKVTCVNVNWIRFEVNMHRVRRVTKFKHLQIYKFTPFGSTALRIIRERKMGQLITSGMCKLDSFPTNVICILLTKFYIFN